MSNFPPRIIFYSNDRSEVSWGWKVGHEGRPPIGEYLSVEEAAARERVLEDKLRVAVGALEMVLTEGHYELCGSLDVHGEVAYPDECDCHKKVAREALAACREVEK